MVWRRCATLDDSRHSQRKQEENSEGTLIFGELPAVPKSVSPSKALEYKAQHRATTGTNPQATGLMNCVIPEEYVCKGFYVWHCIVLQCKSSYSCFLFVQQIRSSTRTTRKMKARSTDKWVMQLELTFTPLKLHCSITMRRLFSLMKWPNLKWC